MFDFEVFTHPYYVGFCRKFVLSHYMQEVVSQLGMRVQTLCNKLNLGQPRQLAVQEV